MCNFNCRYYQDFIIDHQTGESNLTQMYIEVSVSMNESERALNAIE